MEWAKSDFVAGDEIFFEDNLAGEQLGEFPSRWDIIEGNAEVVRIDGVRIINLPNMAAPQCMILGQGWAVPNTTYIRNIRIAKGAVPLYDRMMQDGKFISYGITFDTGKSVIKPESAGELNRIVQLLKENHSLRFSVEGRAKNRRVEFVKL
jgi:hypothetical protein